MFFAQNYHWPEHDDNARLLKSLAHPVRLQLLELIYDMELPVNAFQDQLELPQAVISTQLAVLRRAGVVRVRRQGLNRLYRIEDKRILEIMRLLNPSLPGPKL